MSGDHERLDQVDHVDEVLEPVDTRTVFFASGIVAGGGPRRRRGRGGARVLPWPLPWRSRQKKYPTKIRKKMIVFFKIEVNLEEKNGFGVFF